METKKRLISIYKNKFDELIYFIENFAYLFCDNYSTYIEEVFIYRGIICVVYFDYLYRGGFIAIPNGMYSQFIEDNLDLIEVHTSTPCVDHTSIKDFLLLGFLCDDTYDAHDYNAAIRYKTVRPKDRFYPRPSDAVIRTQEYVCSQLKSMVDQIKKLR